MIWTVTLEVVSLQRKQRRKGHARAQKSLRPETYSGPIVPSSGHHGAGHVLVASRNENASVVLTCDDRLGDRAGERGLKVVGHLQRTISIESAIRSREGRLYDISFVS